MADSYRHEGELRYDEESGGMVYFTNCGKRIPHSPGSTVDSDGNVGDLCPECEKATRTTDATD